MRPVHGKERYVRSIQNKPRTQADVDADRKVGAQFSLVLIALIFIAGAINLIALIVSLVPHR